MLVKCPSCGLQSDCEPGKYLCKCGTILDVAPDGTATVSAGKKSGWIVPALVVLLILFGIGAGVMCWQIRLAREDAAEAKAEVKRIKAEAKAREEAEVILLK